MATHHAHAHGEQTLPTLKAVRPVRGPFREIYGASHVGHHRAQNEDHFLTVDIDRTLSVTHSSVAAPTTLPGTRCSLLIVADGMGGYAGGELASAVTVDTIVDYVMHHVPWAVIDEAAERALQEGFQQAALECQRRLRQAAERHGASPQAGSTLTAAYAAGQDLYVAHVGDSRAYLVRQDGQSWRLTHDHTLAEAIGSGGEDDQFSHILTNAIGGDVQAPRVECLRVRMEPGDRVLLASDGLTRYLDDATITAHLRGARTAKDAAEAMIHAVLEDEARDNVTVVVAFV